MSRRRLREVLRRLQEDGDFLNDVLVSPREALSEFNLSDEDMAALGRRDNSVFGLIGRLDSDDDGVTIQLVPPPILHFGLPPIPPPPPPPPRPPFLQPPLTIHVPIPPPLPPPPVDLSPPHPPPPHPPPSQGITFAWITFVFSSGRGDARSVVPDEVVAEVRSAVGEDRQQAITRLLHFIDGRAR